LVYLLLPVCPYCTWDFRDFLSNIYENPKVVIVDNKLDDTFCKTFDGNTTVIGSLDTHNEFSSFQSGMEYIQQDLNPDSIVIFATSAFLNPPTEYIPAISRNINSLKTKSPTALGYSDSFGESFSISDLHSSFWLRTSIFALNFSALSCLDFTILHDLDFSILASSNLRNHVTSWLSNHPNYKNADDSLLKKRLFSIFHEKFLTLSMLNVGISIVDVRKFM